MKRRDKEPPVTRLEDATWPVLPKEGWLKIADHPIDAKHVTVYDLGRVEFGPVSRRVVQFDGGSWVEPI